MFQICLGKVQYKNGRNSKKRNDTFLSYFIQTVPANSILQKEEYILIRVIRNVLGE